MPNLYYIFVTDEEEGEILCDNVVMGEDNAKEMFLKYQKLYCSDYMYHVRTVDCHPVYFDDKGLQLVDSETWICW